MTIDWTEHEQQQREFAAGVSAKITGEIARISGAKLISAGGPASTRQSRRYLTSSYATTHLQGGAIMSATADTGVVNPWLQHWQVANLWVVGASAFPQNSSSHPTLTSVALTLRAADALIDRYLKHPGALA
jgi:gluconate 2-dehydrogenase alpha chain